MKSRQKFAVSEKHLLRRTESEGHYLDLRVRRRSSTNPLVQKNINFLHSYNNLLRKPFFQQVGDADTYFRQTLRNDPFDIVRDLNLKGFLVKQAKSFENINKRKLRTRYTLVSPSGSSKKDQELRSNLPRDQNKDSFKELYIADAKEQSDTDTETTTKEYFTPKADNLQSPLNSEDEYTARESSDYLNPTFQQLELGSIMAEENLDDTIVPDITGEEEGDENINIEDQNAVVEDEQSDVNYTNEEPTEEEEFPVTDAETEDDEIKEVEKMIEAASQELQQVVEENEKMMGALEEEGEEEAVDETGGEKIDKTSPLEGGDGSFFKFDPTIDSAVLKELEAAEKQAKQTAKIICELRDRVSELLKKEKMTQVEAKELEEKNKLLKSQMMLFEEKIKRIQFLIGQTNLFENMVAAQPPLQKKHKADALPKVIVCGLADNNIPKIIVCDDSKKKKKRKCTKKEPRDDSPRTEIAKKLNECYCMQEKLAAENANLEGKRYELQSDLLNKDQTVECLQKQLTSLQTEMRMICQENRMLNSTLQKQCTLPNFGHQTGPQTKCAPHSLNQQKSPCGRGKGICPADIESRLQEYSNNTQNLEKHLDEMEAEVKNMQQELTAVHKEREHLEHHRKMLCNPPPCAIPPCALPPCAVPPCVAPPSAIPPCAVKRPCGYTEEDEKPKSDQQLRELREQYNRLQDDFKSKLIEVAGLRADNEKLKDSTKAAEEIRKAADSKLKELEVELKKFKGQSKVGVGPREQLIEMEQQLNVSKQRFREAQDELEELRCFVEDQRAQTDDYRSKYLGAQQLVEEQKRQIDLMEVENQHVSEQVNLEIQRVKNQFQEKLQELVPLPDILKSTQLKLKEAQQMHLLAERNNEAMAKELQLYKDKLSAVSSQMDKVRSDQQLGADEKAILTQKIEDLQQELTYLQEEQANLLEQIDELTEKSDENERLAEGRLHEITQLESQLENVRGESARQVARTKDRCEIIRKSMQNEINDLERQIAQSKAIAKAAQKDRDDIRQKMQTQINNLNDNFEDAQMRIKNLQGHVNFMKNTYGELYTKETCDGPTKKLPDPCNCSSEY